MLSLLTLAYEDSEHDRSNSLLDASVCTLRLQQIKRYIAENLSDPLLNVNRVARANSLTRFSSAFRNATGFPRLMYGRAAPVC